MRRFRFLIPSSIFTGIVFLALFFFLYSLPVNTHARGLEQIEIDVEGLKAPVEIFIDPWGIAHIYAQNEEDLFFAQGFNVARDRLFQLEMWRRQATGTLSEILGPRALKKDIGSRLFCFRGEMRKELAHYHPRGEKIIPSFVRGINSYIDWTRKNPEMLPLEFRLLDIEPGYWTPEIVVSRHNGLFRNATTEVRLAKAVSALGSERVKELMNFKPADPELAPPEGVDLSLIPKNLLELYLASRSPVTFLPEDIADASLRAEAPGSTFLFESFPFSPGSNNWALRGSLTFSSRPILANDPHRRLQIPSLRYWVHLCAPGWHVMGGGEPALPGVSIGHNEYGAWGLTIFPIDQEDIYIYSTNPAHPNQYRYRGKWEEMEIIREEIPVKGEEPVTIELKYTCHGPVLYEDQANHLAYALRAGWLEVGGAPYLASLRMDQARNWEEFRKACTYSRTPSENMVWADTEGHIGWQVVGIAPRRESFSGLLPVPGDGRYEWKGYIPIEKLPHSSDPAERYVATANQFNVPPGYPYLLGYMWSDSFRFSRICEVLVSGRKFTLVDMMELQHDEYSLPARALVPLLKGLKGKDEKTEKARRMLLSWDIVMARDSVEAAIFHTWLENLGEELRLLLLSDEERQLLPGLSLEKIISSLVTPDNHFGENPVKGRNALLLRALTQAVEELTSRLGEEWKSWEYGQTKFHHVKLRHPLSRALKKEWRQKLDIGPYPRGGSRNTVNMTTDRFNQTSGATFRLIADVGEWDNSLGSNCPGQSGDPQSAHYSDLFEMWARGEYFPLYFSRQKVESAAEKKIVLK
ncbi:MAG: penicillin acylase family protein [Candidatus Aminicenantales bacterium]